MAGRLYIYTDGGSRGNPGPAAIGIVLLDKRKILLEHKERIGKATNNQAEYCALIKALELASRYRPAEVVCTSDSELLIKQVQGEYKIRNTELQRLHAMLKERERALPSVAYRHARRTHPRIQRADCLVNEALDAAQGRV